uniref:Adhesion G protein-coupled receptor F3 n=1 Tax=Latimeria chalumnae TaxID=7897 RepID=H3AFU6_LATCH
ENYYVNSIIHSTSVRVNKKNKKDVHIKTVFELKNKSTNLQDVACVYWNFSQEEAAGGWAKEGCQTKTSKQSVTCSCKHLTSFAVLMSKSSLEEPGYIEMITYLGLGASIGSLCFCIFIELLVWSSVVKTKISHFRHMALVNTAISLLLADLCFLSTSFDFVQQVPYVCIAITFLNHFLYLSLFFWSLCQSMMLLHQLCFTFSWLRRKIYMPVSFIVGYLFPLGIAAGTFLYFHPKNKYHNTTLCWLDKKEAFYAFAIPVASIVLINLLALIVVITKLIRPSVSDTLNADEKYAVKQIVKAVLVLTPIFGLTWAFGFFLLLDFPKEFHNIFKYIFTGMNAFQGLLILLANTFADKKSLHTCEM